MKGNKGNINRKFLLLMILLFIIIISCIGIFIKLPVEIKKEVTVIVPYEVEEPLIYSITEHYGRGCGSLINRIYCYYAHIKNIDKYGGKFRMNCDFKTNHHNVIHDSEIGYLMPGQSKILTCRADIDLFEDVKPACKIIPGLKTIIKKKKVKKIEKEIKYYPLYKIVLNRILKSKNPNSTNINYRFDRKTIGFFVNDFFNSNSSIKIPKNYYKTDNFPDFNPSEGNLKSFIKFNFVMPKGYILNTFDCSEMAAYTEWALKDAGFEAYIATGKAPSDSNTYHAWIIVYLPDGKEIPIEPTALMNKDDDLFLYTMKYFIELIGTGFIGIINALNPYYEKYFDYDDLYISIYDIPKSKLVEYDWWGEYSYMFK